VGRPIAAGMGKLVQKLAVRAFRQPLPRQGWAQQVAAEVFERLSGVRGQGDVSMKGESLPASTTGFLLVHHGGRRAETAHGMTGARAGGETLWDGGGGQAGQERHLVGDGIGGAGVLGQATAAAQESLPPVVDLRQDAGDLLVRGRRQGMKHRWCWW